jgi:hypothetical protein
MTTTATATRQGGVRVLGKLSNGELLVQIRTECRKGSVVGNYTVARIPSDFGDAFAVVKVPDAGAGTSDDETVYHVNLDDSGSSCSCPDHVYRSSKCRHISACMALSDARRI